MFSRKGKKSSSLSRINYSNNNYSIEFLQNRIHELDIQIAEVTREIFNTQLVRARSMFSGNTNFIQGFQKRIVESSAINSLQWHKRRLNEINFERNTLQDQLDRHTGKYWSKRIKKLFVFISLWIFIALMCGVVFLGFVAALYLLPVFGFIVLSYLIIKKLKI